MSATIPTHAATISERTKTVKNGGSCSFTLADDGSGGLFSFINNSILYTGNYSITYTCPDGITMKLKDSATGKFDLTKSGNTYTLTSLNPVGGSSNGGYLEEPVVYSVSAPEGTKSLTVTATKSFITLDGKTTLSTTSPRKFVIIPDDEAVYVQYTSNASYLNSTDKAGTLNKQIKSSNENFCDVGNIHGPGYSGTMILSKYQGAQITNLPLGNEGRATVLELEIAYLINIYVPNAFKRNLSRRNYRAEWDDNLYEYISTLSKPVILCGDFNVDIDFIREKGFMSEEKESFERLKSLGLRDVYRSLYPDEPGFTWYSGRNHVGRRLDGFLVSECIFNRVTDIKIYDEELSDHIPMGIYIND